LAPLTTARGTSPVRKTSVKALHKNYVVSMTVGEGKTSPPFRKKKEDILSLDETMWTLTSEKKEIGGTKATPWESKHSGDYRVKAGRFFHKCRAFIRRKKRGTERRNFNLYETSEKVPTLMAEKTSKPFCHAREVW